MDFQWSDDERTFRDQLREWFGANPPPGGGADAETGRDYHRRLHAEGWATMHWPAEYGGQGAGHLQQLLLKEEANRVGVSIGSSGTSMVGPTLMLHGSEELRREHLPRIASGDVRWCQGFSEPGAGSDLASLQTRAVRDGDEYVVNGEKVWTSGAHEADWMFLLVRTDPEAPKHRGISYLLVDMETPGLTVSPLIQMTGEHGFNQEFFEDVRVPVGNRVGEENRGWYVATTTLDFERSGIERVFTADRDIGRIEAYWRDEGDAIEARGGADAKRARSSELRIATEVSRLLAYRVAWMQGRGLVPNHEASMAKMYGSDVGQWVAQLGANIAGLGGQLYRDEPHAPLGGMPAFRYLDSMRLTIGQGTGEIQRNIIATRGLGLPRG